MYSYRCLNRCWYCEKICGILTKKQTLIYLRKIITQKYINWHFDIINKCSMQQYVDIKHIVHPLCVVKHVMRQQGFSIWLGLLVVWGHVETQSHDIEVFLHGALPWLFCSSPLSLAMRCPSEGCFGDGVGGHAADMSQPLPPPCLYNYFHTCSIFQWSILVAWFECRFLVTEVDGLNPGNSMLFPWARYFICIASVDSAVKWAPGGDNLMKSVQCYELFGGIALKNHAFSFF